MTHSNIYPFKTRPYAHQSEAWEQSKSQSEFALFMEMGTGKSKVIVDNIAYLYDTGRIDTAIIVAPKGVYRNWINSELPTHMPDHVKYTTAVWTATPKKEEAQALEAIRFPSHDLRILVVNVEAFSTKRAVQWLDKFMLVAGKVFMCVDESTTIKNPSAARTKSLIKIGRQAHYRRILTGEPVTRSPMDLYSQCQFLDPALLGFSSYYSFRSRYAIMVDMKAGARSFKKVVGFQRLEELSDMIKSFSFSISLFLQSPSMIGIFLYFGLVFINCLLIISAVETTCNTSLKSLSYNLSPSTSIIIFFFFVFLGPKLPFLFLSAVFSLTVNLPNFFPLIFTNIFRTSKPQPISKCYLSI